MEMRCGKESAYMTISHIISIRNYYKFYKTRKLPSLTTLNFLRCFKEFFFTLLDIIMRGNYNVSTFHFDTYPNPNSPCAHLFILIIFDPISHIYAVHTQRKVYHSMPLHTYIV